MDTRITWIVFFLLTLLMIYIYYKNYQLLKDASEGKVLDYNSASMMSKVNLALLILTIINAVLMIGIVSIWNSKTFQEAFQEELVKELRNKIIE